MKAAVQPCLEGRCHAIWGGASVVLYLGGEGNGS